MLLEGKSAIVTGGSQGIGAAISLELAREGADICLTYRKHEAEAKNYAAEIEAMGRKALALQCDISVYAEAEATVKTALETFGQIDILVNNAGMNWDGVSWKMTEEQWDRVIEVNLKGRLEHFFGFGKGCNIAFDGQCLTANGSNFSGIFLGFGLVFAVCQTDVRALARQFKRNGGADSL